MLYFKQEILKMKKRLLRNNNAAYFAVKSLELSQISSAKVAASMTTAIVKNVIRQEKEEHPEASKEELLSRVREILALCD